MDHLKHDSEMRSFTEAQQVVTQASAIVTQKHILERADQPGTLPERVDRAIVNGVVITYENSSKIDDLAKLKNNNYDAVDVTKLLLSELNCESAESYLTKLSDYHKDVDRFKMYIDADTIERRRFTKFLESVIASGK